MRQTLEFPLLFVRNPSISIRRANLFKSVNPAEFLALDEALGRLVETDALKGELVKLRFFAGLTLQQAAVSLGISLSTAERHWAFARAWLYNELQEDK